MAAVMEWVAAVQTLCVGGLLLRILTAELLRLAIWGDTIAATAAWQDG